MSTLVIYDSLYGNTKKIAEAIGEAVGGKVVHANVVNLKDVKNAELVIIGSPVHGGRATPAVDVFLRNLPADSLKGKKIAAFDTRFAPEDHGVGIKIVLYVIRYAAERIAKQLQKKGGKLVKKAEGFIVEDKEGPLRKGELERARMWGRGLQQL